jgi:hypothetical protein
LVRHGVQKNILEFNIKNGIDCACVGV